MATTKSNQKRLVMGTVNETDQFAWMPIQATLQSGLPGGWGEGEKNP